MAVDRRTGSVQLGSRQPVRGGRVIRALLIALVLMTAAGAAGWYGFSQMATAKTEEKPLTHEINRSLFSHVVTENGEIESSSNIEVRCEVQSRNTTGTAILEIVPEGTLVKKNDLICRLDASSLDSELNQQQIVCNTSEATVIKARSTVETAGIAREEYLNGTFKQEEQTIKGEVSVAEENLSRAEDYARYSRKLATKGYVTPLQLEADEFAVEKARMDLETANTKLEVLRKYTRAKMLSQLEADIAAAQATLRSEESTHKLDLEKLELTKAQIAKCVILAPADGQVVYANQSDRRSGGNEVIIDQGVLVRERQVIVRLPDPAKMQVKAKINESRIDRVREGLPVSVRLDAFPDEELSGTVTRVEEYPTPGNFWSSVKEYATYIRIDNSHSGRLRPGLTAQVQIYVEQVPDAIQVPVQAVFEHGADHYCLTYQPGHPLEPHKVQIGSTNDKFVIIKDGLNAPGEVLLNPRRYLASIDLPAPSEIAGSKLLAREIPPPAAKAAVQVAASDRGDSGANGDGATAATAEKPAGGAPAAGGEAGERRGRRGAGGAGGAGGMGGMDPDQMAGMFLQNSDKDGDGKLTEEEYPEQFRSRFAATDTNGDKFIDRAEITAALKKMQAQMRAGGGMPGGPSGGGQ